MNEKKLSQQQQQTQGNAPLTVSAHHQKRQQSLGVTSSGVPVMPSHSNQIAAMQVNFVGNAAGMNTSNASAPGGIGLLMGSGTNNIVNINMQNVRGSGSSGPPPSTNNYIQINTENRAAAAQFIRNSYASGSRMKKAAGGSSSSGNGGPSLVNETANLINYSAMKHQDVQDPQRHNATTQLLQQLEASGLIPAGSSINQAQMKRGSQQSSNGVASGIMDPNFGKKIKVMRNTHGSSGVSGGQPSLLIVPTQQMALQGQLGNMSNIHNQRQKSPTPKSPSNSHQKQPLLQQQNSTPAAQQNQASSNQVVPNTASLKSARRYQLMNSSQQKNPSSLPTHHHHQMINVNSAGLGIGTQGGPGLLPTHTQLSPQNLSQQFQTQFQNSGVANNGGAGGSLIHGNQTLNIQQFKQQISNQKVNLSLERPSNHNNDLILQSPNSSDTNSSINSLDQTLRLRIGGPLPKGMLSSSQSSSSGTSAGVHPNHFYQSSSLNREMNVSNMGNNSSSLFMGGGHLHGSGQQSSHLQMQVGANHHNLNQQSTNNSNFNSLDYSEIAAMSSRRMFNESVGAGNQGGPSNNFSQSQTATQQQTANTISNSSNVKRNNFLAMFNGQDGSAGAAGEGGIKSPEGGSHSQPNPPTLRKITLNQRILQKNMARVSASNQVQHQTINNNQEQNQLRDEGAMTQVSGTIRQKKFINGGQVPTKAAYMHQSAPNQQTLGPRDTSVSSTASDQTNHPMINVARIQQAISKVYGSQRKNSILANSQHQPPATQVSQGSTSFNQDVSNSTSTIEGAGSASQLKRKQIKMKQGSSFGAPMVMVGESIAQMSMTTQPTNASTDQQMKSGGNVPQLNLNSVSQETGMSSNQQNATSPINMKSHIHQGHIASSSRRQMRETQRSKINMTQQDTARGVLPLPTGNIQSIQQQLELTNRSHLAHAPMHVSDPLPVQTANQQMVSHRGEPVASINPRTLTSARRDREHQLRSVNAVGSSHMPLDVPAPSNVSAVKTFLDIEKPTTPQLAIRYGRQYLTAYELQEIIDYPQIYYIGENCKRKVQGSNSNEFNYGYDDNKGNYKVNLSDHIGYRYEIQQFLGKGSFGQALRCFDHKRQEMVALKVIKNKKKYYYQAGVELKILQYLRDNDPDDTMNIIHMKDYVIFRKHLCISFELMSINLYDFLKLNDFDGLSLSLIRRFAIQLLYALKYLKENDIIHCDLKPENILLKDPTKSGIKIIDFGSSCFIEERVYTYIQSRFYRAPEIILGIPYTTAIDMWSFGCIMAEFCIGYPLFPGEDEMEQLAMMMEVCDKPSSEVLKTSQRRKKFFNDDNTPILVPNRKHMVRVPGSKDLSEILETDDESFIDFVRKCLDWDPATRMTPDEALRHAWILEGLPPKVLIHHQKLHNIPTSELPPKIREIRQQYLLKEQQAAAQQQNGHQLIMNQQYQQIQGQDVPQTQTQQQYRSEPRRQQPSIMSQGGQNNNSAVIKRVSNQQLLGMTQQHPGVSGVAQSDTRLPHQHFNQTQQIPPHHQQLNQTQPLIMSQQQQQLLQLSNNGGAITTGLDQTQLLHHSTNLISPRTKKIVMNNGGGQQLQMQVTSTQDNHQASSLTAANKNHLILKTTTTTASINQNTNVAGSTNHNQDTNKSLENTLRNRKIILSSGLKRSSEGGGNAGIANNNNGSEQGASNAISTSLTRKQIIFANNNNGAGAASMASNMSNGMMMISDL